MGDGQNNSTIDVPRKVHSAPRLLKNPLKTPELDGGAPQCTHRALPIQRVSGVEQVSAFSFSRLGFEVGL